MGLVLGHTAPMKWSIGMVIIFVFSLLAPPVMPIAEPIVVADAHETGGFDRPIEDPTESEDSEVDADGEVFFIATISLSENYEDAADRFHFPLLYQNPDLWERMRPPRA